MHVYASMQVCKYASMKVCKYASMDTYASMQVCKYIYLIYLISHEQPQ